MAEMVFRFVMIAEARRKAQIQALLQRVLVDLDKAQPDCYCALLHDDGVPEAHAEYQFERIEKGVGTLFSQAIRGLFRKQKGARRS